MRVGPLPRWVSSARAAVILLGACGGALALVVVPAQSRTFSASRVAVSTSPPPAGVTLPGAPIVIGHHGASGQLPANTLASFDLAIQEGADYVEPDVVLTRDGALIARHENNLAYTTDVARHREFASLRRTKHINGYNTTGWFAEDLTLAQIHTLRVRNTPGTPRVAGGYAVPTLQQIIDLVRTDEHVYHRTIGLAVEVKDGAFLNSVGRPVEPVLAALLARNDLNRAGSPVFVESPEASVLARMHRLSPVRLMWVLPAMPRPAGRAAILAQVDSVAPYTAAIAVDASWLAPLRTVRPAPSTPVRRGAAPSAVQAGEWLIRVAAADHLAVYVYTLGRSRSDYVAYATLGIAGVFSDYPHVALRVYG